MTCMPRLLLPVTYIHLHKVNTRIADKIIKQNFNDIASCLGNIYTVLVSYSELGI